MDERDSLIINLPGTESWDTVNERFVYSEGVQLELVHSLVTLSKWEIRFEKHFLSNEKKTSEETFAYIQMMSLTPVDIETLHTMSNENLAEINAYIERKSTATWFKDTPGQGRSREIITNEIIYHWMFALQIPKETEHWHLNRLFTLIKVINEKNQPKKKMGRAEALAQQRKLNAERLAASGSSG